MAVVNDELQCSTLPYADSVNGSLQWTASPPLNIKASCHDNGSDICDSGAGEGLGRDPICSADVSNNDGCASNAVAAAPALIDDDWTEQRRGEMVESARSSRNGEVLVTDHEAWKALGQSPDTNIKDGYASTAVAASPASIDDSFKELQCDETVESARSSRSGSMALRDHAKSTSRVQSSDANNNDGYGSTAVATVPASIDDSRGELQCGDTVESARSSRSGGMPLRNHATWKSRAQSQLNTARAARLGAMAHIQDVAHSSHYLPRKDHQDISYDVLAAQDKLKRRAVYCNGLAIAHRDYMITVDHLIFRVNSCVTDLQRGSSLLWGHLSVARKRLELREKRPLEELVIDDFQEALLEEQRTLQDARGRLSGHVESCKTVLQELEVAKSKMTRRQHVFHLDRSNQPQEFFANMRSLDARATQICSGGCTALRKCEADAENCAARTSRTMKARIAELYEMRMSLQRELQETRNAIAGAEWSLERIKKELLHCDIALDDVPCGNVEDGEQVDAASPATLSVRSIMGIDAETHERLRSRIKAAAYTGASGRQLHVIFQRFDLDRTGTLEEDDLRRALRRTLKIPPSVISDADISLAFARLDADGSGAISIRELVSFLGSEDHIAKLQQQQKTTIEILEHLSTVSRTLEFDIKAKTAAWQLDDACSKITPVKGLSLHSALPKLRGKTPSNAHGTINTYVARGLEKLDKKPLPLTAADSSNSNTESRPITCGRPGSVSDSLADSRWLAATAKVPCPRSNEIERLQAKALAAIKPIGKHGPRQLATIFSRFDGDGMGRLGLDEICRALRHGLAVPESAFSDDDIAVLVKVLNCDNTGCILIRDLVPFFNEETPLTVADSAHHF